MHCCLQVKGLIAALNDGSSFHRAVCAGHALSTVPLAALGVVDREAGGMSRTTPAMLMWRAHDSSATRPYFQLSPNHGYGKRPFTLAAVSRRRRGFFSLLYGGVCSSVHESMSMCACLTVRLVAVPRTD